MLFDETKFKPVVRYGRQIPGYYVSKDGQVFSTKTQRIIKYGTTRSKRTDRIECLKFTANVPKDFFEDYSYRQRREGENTATISLTAHRTVMEVWKPIDENPPEQLKETWDQVPEEWRQWARETALIDHIDNDPTNNHVDNLRWVTPKENNVFRKKVKFSDPNVIELSDEEYEWVIQKSEELGKTPQETFDYLWESYMGDVHKKSEESGIPIEAVLLNDVEEYVKDARIKGLAQLYKSDQEESD